MALSIRIIPCLDVDNGRVVKGINFINLVDAGDPVEMAKKYEAEGADEITFLDISASSEERATTLSIVEKTAETVFIPLTVGGGIRSVADVDRLLRAGADKVSINTAAVLNHNFIKESSIRFGSQCIIAAIDVKKISPGRWEVFTHGGRKATGIDVINYAKILEEKGAGEILLTSMDRDGTKMGYDIELTSIISNLVSIPVIASGGVGNLEHIYEGFKEGGASAVLAASVFHYKQFTIKDVKNYLKNKNIPVRI